MESNLETHSIHPWTSMHCDSMVVFANHCTDINGTPISEEIV